MPAALLARASHSGDGYHSSRAGPGSSAYSFYFPRFPSLCITSRLNPPQLRLATRGCGCTGLCGKWQVGRRRHCRFISMRTCFLFLSSSYRFLSLCTACLSLTITILYWALVYQSGNTVRFSVRRMQPKSGSPLTTHLSYFSLFSPISYHSSLSSTHHSSVLFPMHLLHPATLLSRVSRSFSLISSTQISLLFTRFVFVHVF